MPNRRPGPGPRRRWRVRLRVAAYFLQQLISIGRRKPATADQYHSAFGGLRTANYELTFTTADGDLEFVLRPIQHTARWIILAVASYQVMMGIQDVPHDQRGKEQNCGETQNQRDEIVILRYTGAVSIDSPVEVSPNTEKVGDLGRLPQQIGTEFRPGEHREGQQPQDVLRGPDLVREQERGHDQEQQLR